MTSQHFQLFLLAIAFTFLSACAMAPTQEMSDARQAVQAAREAGAEKHAHIALAQAEKLLIAAEDNLGLKTYRQARNNAVAAKTQAISARKLAVAIAEATKSIDSAKALGVTTKEATVWLERASAFAQTGDFGSALDAAQRAKALAEHDLNDHKK